MLISKSHNAVTTGRKSERRKLPKAGGELGVTKGKRRVCRAWQGARERPGVSLIENFRFGGATERGMRAGKT